MLPHLLPFWFLFVGGSPPPAWRTAAKESASPARIAWLRQPKRVAFRLFQPSHACKNMVYLGGRSKKKLFGIFHHASCNLHTHKARSMQDAVCHCIDLPLCVCMVTLRAPFCWLNKQSSYKPRSMQHAFAALVLACVSGDHVLQEYDMLRVPGPAQALLTFCKQMDEAHVLEPLLEIMVALKFGIWKDRLKSSILRRG